MKNYTTQTAALKATTIDTRLLDAKQINTEKLFINGELFDPSNINGGTSEPSQIKESPNEAMFNLVVRPNLEDSYDEFPGEWHIVSNKEKWVDYGPDDQWWDNVVQDGGELIKGSQTEGVLPNGIYIFIQIDDNFVKCISENSLDDTDASCLNVIPHANFSIVSFTSTLTNFEQCILENFITLDTENDGLHWAIKLCEEDDNLSELYGGTTEDNTDFLFLISIPYYIPENDYTSSSSSYSLRKTNLFDNLREKFEEMRQRSLDKSAE